MAPEPSELSSDEVIEQLRRVDLFQGMADDELRAVSEVVNGVTVQDGNVLFEEGEPGDCFYVVSDGAVQITKSVEGGGEEKLAVRRTGDAFGEMAILTSSLRTASVIALEDCVFRIVTADILEREMLGMKPWLAAITRALARNLLDREKDRNG